MKVYKTVNEVKQNLPEILKRINDCKLFVECDIMLLAGAQRLCIDEYTHPERDHGWWTTIGAHTEILKNQMQHQAELEYLKGLVRRLPEYKSRVI